MGVFGAFSGCRGDTGFTGPLLGASSGVVGFNVTMLSRLVREKVRPAVLSHRESAKKFALRCCLIVKARNSSPCTLKTPQNRRFYACWANYFAEEPREGPCWASFFAEMRLEARCWASFSRQSVLRPGLVGDVAHEAGCGGGFCSIRSWLAACRRRVVPLMTPFPPFGGSPAEPPPIGLTCEGT